MKRPDGVQIPVEISSSEATFGTSTSRIVIVRDVTERRNHEAALRESRAFLSSIIDNVPIGILTKSVRSDMRIVQWNQAAARIHELPPEEAVGRTAERDFLSFVDSVSRLEGGVYLSVGSAVMSPMIFEKALSMSRNVARQRGGAIENFSIHVVDLANSAWDWVRDGEPPQDNPAYYLRFCKTFSRMGGRMTYTSADNRSFLVALLRELERAPAPQTIQ